ncbi:MAG: hypothetical protein R2856_10505 [Caldilineaceae bacterium]
MIWYDHFTQNRTIVLSIYGQVFFVLGWRFFCNRGGTVSFGWL